MKVTRADEYWGVPERGDSSRTSAPLSRAEIADLVKGPRIPSGSLYHAAVPGKNTPGLRQPTPQPKGAAEVDDPSLTPGAGDILRGLPNATDIGNTLYQGGPSGTDGTPERWPGRLPGDKVLDAADEVGDGFAKSIDKKLPKPDPKKEKTARRRRYAAAPDPNDLYGTGKTLGTHDAEVHNDSQGQGWLVKHPRFDESWPAPLDTGTAALQQRSGLATPEIHEVNMNGVPTPVHKMIPGAKDAFPGKRFDHSQLSPQDVMTLQKHNVFDWLISNHDAHPGQFMRDPQSGELVGIDKGQAFRYFGQDKLSPNFHPNKSYHETEPIYNTMWRNFGNGQGHMHDPRSGELGLYINNLQSMPDEEFQSYLRPYAEQAAQYGKLGTGGGLGQPGHITPNDPDSFLAAATARKNNLSNDFANYYTQALAKRQGAGSKVGRRVYR
jgi:hypothetical protein